MTEVMVDPHVVGRRIAQWIQDFCKAVDKFQAILRKIYQPLIISCNKACE